MMNTNICKFIPVDNGSCDLNTINFVYEQDIFCITNKKVVSVYTLNLIMEGEGSINIFGRKYNLKAGDIYFQFPGTTYKIESENMKIMYISFFGKRANKILDKLKITRINCIFEGYKSLRSFWKSSINSTNESNSDMMTESVLLHTFSLMASNFNINEKPLLNDIVTKIKKYADENFTDKELSLKNTAEKYHYNKKYLSTVFKKQIGMGFNQYINNLRIQYAYSLIEEGFSGVKDIANQCGFSDQLYFSKVFKERTGVSPNFYIKKDKNF